MVDEPDHPDWALVRTWPSADLGSPPLSIDVGGYWVICLKLGIGPRDLDKRDPRDPTSFCTDL